MKIDTNKICNRIWDGYDRVKRECCEKGISWLSALQDDRLKKSRHAVEMPSWLKIDTNKMRDHIWDGYDRVKRECSEKGSSWLSALQDDRLKKSLSAIASPDWLKTGTEKILNYASSWYDSAKRRWSGQDRQQ
ncbi:unnamed protein product [Anisakis simplex]|uniref:Antiterminator n=1 Tax=Anisakis simplex TaxID=6269 RepID=A0A0M3KBH2_ANISI|nr:unnamed protein product [Anisakis simplex]